MTCKRLLDCNLFWILSNPRVRILLELIVFVFPPPVSYLVFIDSVVVCEVVIPNNIIPRILFILQFHVVHMVTVAELVRVQSVSWPKWESTFVGELISFFLVHGADGVLD